jgi:hypothetical protein
MRALILAVASALKPGEAAKSLKYLAALGVRLLTASSTRSASVETPLAEAARKVFSGELKTAASIKKELAGIAPSDAAFSAAMETVKVSNARLARYMLRSLELAHESTNEPYFIPNDGEVINLEHVLPKRPDADWDDWTEDDRRNYVSRLGNQVLMLASDNAHLKSSSFAKKKPAFAKSPYALTNQVAQADEWTPARVHERQQTLAELAPRAWPL